MKLHVAELAIILFCFLFSSSTVQAQECTERFMKLSVVEYRAQQIGTNAVSGGYMDRKFRVLQEYQFNCSSTNITSLILGIDVRETTSNRSLFPSVQVFRPNGNIVNQYDLVTGSERTIYYSTSNVSEVFEYPLNPPISVISGDLLAVSQPKQGGSVVRVHYINRDEVGGISFSTSQEMNYGETTVDLGSSPTTDLFFLVYPVTDGYCVNSTNSITASVIRENALRIHGSQASTDRRQYLYPEIVFSCNGTVTKWIYGATQDTGTSQPELQIWRQLGPNNYIKIGSSLVNAGTMNGTNLYEFIPQTPVQFQEEDIFGVHIPRNSQSELIIMYEQDGSGPINYRVSGNVDAPLSTITEALAIDGNDFPLVTVEISVSTSNTSSLLSAEIETSSIGTKTSLPMISANLTSMISTAITSSSLMIAITMISTTPISSFATILSAAATPSFVISTPPSHNAVISSSTTPSYTASISAEGLANVSNDFVLVTVEVSISTSSSVISISSYETSTNIISSMITTPVISMNASLTSVISLISTTPISSFMTSAALSSLPVISTATVTVLSTAVTSTVPVAVIGGVVAAIMCIILAFLTITLTVIVFIKKRANKTGRIDIPANADSDTPLKASPTGIENSVSINSFAISTMESNPAYMASTDINTTSIQANPAYASTTNTNNMHDIVGSSHGQNDAHDDYDYVLL